MTGVWLDGLKVGAIGVGCKRWITQHGMALNVNCEMGGFEAIIPCGLEGKSVGRLNDWIPELKTADVQPLIRESLTHHFDFRWN